MELENTFKDAVQKIKDCEYVTVIVNGDFGFVNIFIAKVIGAEYTSYAQYKNAIKLIFKKPRQRLARYVHLHEGVKFLVLKGQHEIENKIFNDASPSVDGISFAVGKYRSCDPRWFTDAVEKTVGIESIIYNEKGY